MVAVKEYFQNAAYNKKKKEKKAPKAEIENEMQAENEGEEGQHELADKN